MAVLAMLNRPSKDAPAHDPAADAFHFADAGSPQLSVLDLGATRGDGIFETISVGYGRPQALEHHLRRFASSARTLALPEPDLDAWRDAILAVVARIEPADEAYVKTVMTRGIEGGDKPTGWVYGSVSPDNSRVRREGIRVVLLDRGYRHDIEATAPWLLAGAKTLSYAVNRAVAREAARREADDVVFVSSDGVLLEGPTSTLVLRRGDELITPGTGLGILDGTTQANVFRFAESKGMSTGFELAAPDVLLAADAAWLVSSVRLAAPIRAVDGVEKQIDHEFTAELNEYLKHLED
ncbi:MAG: 4-amino-4-deoxychorismate lyase [Micrococcales bacterium 70-64]|nr:aminotransferase class IV [Leifsonia sp.]ODU63994.1 MAG: branched-chain amino acid aminotransferase [Leifsonia sp. SCN 70-46]OJX85685.1 MAG: 4-amino-4-deoxychorismate lyase [Micrococcales bacterium 70-64]